MVILKPISAEAFPDFFEQAVTFYAAQNVAAGRFTESDAQALSRADTLKLLPDGIETAGQFFFSIVEPSEDEPVGYLWLASMPRGSSRVLFVCQIIIKPERRRRGYARSALLAAERLAVEHGLSGIALHVFAHNAEAQALYRTLGYNVASLNMLKALGPGDA
jgi:ribosomal protein S18 acetylase RimI-like enzyme